MTEASIADWQPNLSIEAGAAATLLGLVFVAASINLKRIVLTPALPGRVVEAVVQFTQVLFVSMLMTIPHQSTTVLGVEILLVAALSWAVQVTVFVRYQKLRPGDPNRWLIFRTLQSHLATLPFVIGAVCLLFGRHDALYWTVPGFLFSFFAGIVNSWVLLIRVGRQKHTKSGGKKFGEPSPVISGRSDRPSRTEDIIRS
jgi:hypothetical protein